MSGHEFKVHHHVNELMSHLNVRGTDGPGAEVYTEMLLKNMTPYVTTQVSSHSAKKKIAESTTTPVEFLQKYDDLKVKNVRELDSAVYLVSKITEDEQTKTFLERNARERADAAGTTTAPQSHILSSLPATGSKISSQQFSELKDKLLKEASAVSIHASSDVLRKVMSDNKPQKATNLPLQPDWLFHRSHLTMDFVTENNSLIQLQQNNSAPIGTLPLALQEAAIMEDLLSCMEGVEGQYIEPQPLQDRYGTRQFTIDVTLDPSLKQQTERILPLCADYSAVVRFIEEKSSFEYGLVNHALSAAMRTLIKDYHVIKAQLEQQQRTGRLSLQQLFFYAQPTMRSMEILASIANSVNKGECIGGAVLTLLHEKTSTMIGDPKGQELCLFLTQMACVPYLEIMEKWIYKGIISDPYSEFLVEENDLLAKERLHEDFNDSYWEQHYTICRERVPFFLEKSAQKILSTGKYLNVIRQCGRNIVFPHAEEIVYTLQERQYVDQIEAAYDYASQILLDVLMKENSFMARLRSIKHYFLLDQGDFIEQFMDMAEDEMKKTIDDIMPTRLESLLELALRTSTANLDPYKDDLRVDLLPFDLITQLFKILSIDSKIDKDVRHDPTDLQLSGLEAFTLDYVVKWPVSLVLNKKALTRYQMLFRHFFYCRHVERQLCNVWITNKTAKNFTLNSATWYAPAFALRQRMLNFVQNFEYYMMFEVVEPNWVNLETKMNSVSNLDDVLALHSDFLNSCLNDCMLTSPELLKIVHKLMIVCVTYTNFIQRVLTLFTSQSRVSQTTRPDGGQPDMDRRRSSTKVLSDHVDLLGSSDTFERTISNFDSNFTRLLVTMLDRIMDLGSTNCEHKLLNIIYRLDFNGYYSSRLEAVAAERSMYEPSSFSSKQQYDQSPIMTSRSTGSDKSSMSRKGSIPHPGASNSQ